MLDPIMDPKRPPAERNVVAPPASGSAAVHFPGTNELPPPYVDTRLVEPETGEEMVRGHRIQVQPSKPEHADPQSRLDRVIGSYGEEDFITATELLTRASPRSDFATDVCVRRGGIDPRTGNRYLEELAFEVVHTQSRRSMTIRAEELTRCGVRRIFAFFVKTNELCEWSPADGRWLPLDIDASISDPALVRPIPVRALLDPAAADDAVVDALDTKGTPRLVELRQTSYTNGRTEGRIEGRIEAIETACELLDIPLGPLERTQLAALDDAGLATLLAHIRTERCWP